MGSMAPPLSAGSIGDYSLDASERVGVGRMGVFSRVVESSAGEYGRSCRDDEDEECRRHTTGLGGPMSRSRSRSRAASPLSEGDDRFCMCGDGGGSGRVGPAHGNNGDSGTRSGLSVWSDMQMTATSREREREDEGDMGEGERETLVVRADSRVRGWRGGLGAEEREGKKGRLRTSK